MGLSQLLFFREFQNINIHRKVYLIGLFVMMIGLPLSSFLTSVAQFVLALNWLIERDFVNKFKQLNKTIYLFLLLPLVHVLWLTNTSDFSWAIHDLKIKLPLLIIPLILGTTRPLSSKELRWVLTVFVFAVFSGSTVSIAILTGIYNVEINDIRDISIYISHIRFSLMVVLSLLITSYYFVVLFSGLSKYKKVGLSLLFLWLLMFLIILQSITGWIAFFVILMFIFINKYNSINSQRLLIGIWFVLIIAISASIGLVFKVYSDFYSNNSSIPYNLPTHTPYGNKYINDTVSIITENGYYLWVLISHEELAQTWPSLSDIPVDSNDAHGFSMENTIIRYLTSRNLPKDTKGLLALDSEDIKMIENGYTSCIYRDKSATYMKLYKVLWEIDTYLKTGDANSKSIVQRVEFNRAALHIISNNFWFGVGTGDLILSYQQTYLEIKSNLKSKNQLRAHNQFITFFVTFGLFGFLITLLSMFYPGVINYKKGGVLLSGFLILIFISMLNEDTLETQAGVTFYIVFYALLSLSNREVHD